MDDRWVKRPKVLGTLLNLPQVQERLKQRKTTPPSTSFLVSPSNPQIPLQLKEMWNREGGSCKGDYHVSLFSWLQSPQSVEASDPLSQPTNFLQGTLPSVFHLWEHLQTAGSWKYTMRLLLITSEILHSYTLVCLPYEEGEMEGADKREGRQGVMMTSIESARTLPASGISFHCSEKI